MTVRSRFRNYGAVKTERSMVRMARQMLSDECGSELVEFALSIWVWSGMVFLILYGTYAIYAEHFANMAAHDAARYAIVRGSTWNGTSCGSTSSMECMATSTDVKKFVVARLAPGLLADKLTVSTTWPGLTSAGTSCDTDYGSNSPNCVVKVEVDYSLTLPFASATALTLRDTAETTILQ